MADFFKTGGCHCGRVRYEILSAPLSVQHCHCSQCRKGFATLSAQGAVIGRQHIRITGEEFLTCYRTSASFEYRFCATCGSRIFAYEDSEPNLMYFMPATLDGGVHPGHPPDGESHIHVGSKAVWERLADDLPKFEAASPDEIVSDLMRQASEDG
ncbi:GFA family protein [Frigidibacter sp. RF13]|uniref:GFA family protein n=1 Tax=Frigidibacter sp. RF13 TaxID=2997340 RepID=UPI0022707B8B|nr:GFA family protein [Frigidibacter sp. RF13]MCY1125737.1 GFA family protein [Frigidibacter sp. RF13]